ncbi:hypothetical protein Q5P01_011460 [Channa striata]|uniref:Ig-like domain-containing protein n=1 Tax=Channa striata TaxID=64152 RepID=A0AA88MTT1_CHASR|nr:hypothetical protein Q5P01_011460 [Channa striata]
MKTAVKDFVILGIISDIIGPGYEDRISFDRTTGSLELRSLTLSDDGEYRVIITPDGGQQLTGSTRLEILVPVSNVKVTVSNVDLVEFNSSVRLSCSSSGSSLSFLWLNGSSEVTDSDRVQLTDGNTNLTIVTVTRYDQGPFRCHVFNAVSDGTSEPVKLSISLPVSNVKVTVSNVDLVEFNSSVRLSCSSSGSSLSFLWLNGSSEVTDSDRVQLTDGNTNLTIFTVTRYQGPFRCQCSMLSNNGTSQPVKLSISLAASNVKVTVSNVDLVEFNSSVRLSFSSSGSSLSFLWLNGSSEVTASDRVQLTDGNTNLTIVNVTRYDQGPFRCKVSNAVSDGTSEPVKLSISCQVNGWGKKCERRGGSGKWFSSESRSRKSIKKLLRPVVAALDLQGPDWRLGRRPVAAPKPLSDWSGRTDWRRWLILSDCMTGGRVGAWQRQQKPFGSLVLTAETIWVPSWRPVLT